jgi:hypothetical protein
MAGFNGRQSPLRQCVCDTRPEHNSNIK